MQPHCQEGVEQLGTSQIAEKLFLYFGSYPWFYHQLRHRRESNEECKCLIAMSCDHKVASPGIPPM
uniref:ZmAO-1 n=1 Tax=Arundo donax TaxID=35708 RepID=A0A0A9D4P0_ARUDO